MVTYFLEFNRYLNLLGIGLVFGVAWFFSRHRSHIPYRMVGIALGLTFVSAFLMLRTTYGQAAVGTVADLVNALYGYAEVGAAFVFGDLAHVQAPWGFIFAFRVLPVIIFFGALMALLLHFRIIQYVTRPITGVMYKMLGTSAAETLCGVANSFLGQTEAPLLVRGYLASMTKSELLAVMIGGMATISGPLLAVYGAMGVPVRYLLASSIMAIPAALLIAKLLLPETQSTTTAQGLHTLEGDDKKTVFDALSSGTQDGLYIALAVGAMLVAFISLIALSNGILGWVCTHLGIGCLTLQDILGRLFSPVGWLFGLTGAEREAAGQLVGMKLVLNELVAYSEMVKIQLSERATMLITFALCGFANFSSIGLQMMGIGALAPERRKDLAELGLYAVLGGTLANLLCACVAGIVA